MSAQVKVGLTLLVAILLFYLGLAWVNNAGFWQDKQTIYIISFEEVDGLLIGDPVDIRGYVSGKVTAIKPGMEQVWVEISMNEELELKSEAAAEIRVKEILGGKQIAILPSTQGQLLQPGDTLQGKSSLDFSSAFSTVGKVVEDIDGELIRSFLTRFDTLTTQFGRFANAIDPQKVSQITDNLLFTTHELRNSLSDVNSRQMISKLDSALHQFSALGITANASLVQINTLTKNISSSTLPKADSSLEKIYRLLDHTDEVLTAASDLLDQAQNPQTAVGYLLKDPDGAQLLDSTLINLNRTLDHLRTKKVHVAMSLSHKKRTFKE